jgi:hypothetical protein
MIIVIYVRQPREQFKAGPEAGEGLAESRGSLSRAVDHAETFRLWNSTDGFRIVEAVAGVGVERGEVFELLSRSHTRVDWADR